MKFKVKKDVIEKEVFAYFPKYCRSSQKFVWWEKVLKIKTLEKSFGWYTHYYREGESK